MTNMRYDDIGDDEIRVIGSEFITNAPPNIGNPEVENILDKNKKKLFSKNNEKNSWKLFLFIGIFIVLIIILFYLFFYGISKNNRLGSDYIQYENQLIKPDVTIEKETNAISINDLKIEETFDTIESVPLHILNPSGGIIKLYKGPLSKISGKILMAAYAADVRADNGEIAGAYVYKGELLSRGHSKQGFCAIINGEIIMGRQSETPLLERAIDQNGYFFRQYSLVHNGELGETTPPGKSIRRALCMKDEKTMVIESTAPVTYEDFSNALRQENVKEAISLMGSVPMAMYKNSKGQMVNQHTNMEIGNQNYIVWGTEK